MNTFKYIKNTKLSSPWGYFFLTYLWSWFFFGITYWLGLNGESTRLGSSLIFLALGGPTVIAIILVYLALNKEGQKDYWKRIIDFKRISLQWYIPIVLLVPSISILAAWLSGYWNSSAFFSNKLPSIFLLILVVPLAPILEELGWRGYVLDRLQEKYSALTASLILGVMWCIWHLPAFFLPGSMFSVMPFSSIEFWLYIINLLTISVVFTWIYNNTNRSTLAAIIFHISIEFSANKGLIPYDQPQHFYNIVLWLIIAVSIIIKFGANRLSLIQKK